MRKTIFVLVFIFSALMLVACGKNPEPTPNPNPTPDPQTITYTVSFNVDGGISVPSIEKEEGSKLGILPTTSKSDYIFKGWFSDTNKTSEVTKDTLVNSNMTLYAKWEIVKFTLTFNTNEGGNIDSVTKDKGTLINKPTDPIKEGYKFVNWTSDSNGKNVVTWPLTLNSDITIYAQWNELVNIGSYLESLFESYKFSPSDVLPDKLRAGGKITTTSSLNNNYNNFVNISDINFTGYSEQWQMILDNLNQAETFFNVLKVVDTLSSTSVVAFNNYLDNNPSDNASYEFIDGIYNIKIEFSDNIISYIIEYSAEVPIFGLQSVQIYLDFNIETFDKVGRIQIGEANSIKYEINEDGFKIASSYLGFRTSIIEVTNNEGLVTGKIHEHMTIAEKSISSAAHFYIDNNYLTVVGNKAGAMIGFSGIVVELYDIKSGNLLGYEVKETLSVLTYDTFFFSLNNQLGITNIKYSLDDETNKMSVYVNNSTEVFVAKKYGGIHPKTQSRRYDIEFRTQYFYVVENEEIVRKEIDVPFIFVQAEKYSEISLDVMQSNSNIQNFSLLISGATKAKIENDYNTLIPTFDLDKETITPEYITEYIGLKK